jgi:hypothetical protein
MIAAIMGSESHDRTDSGRLFRAVSAGYPLAMAFLLWILAVILVVAGIVALFRRELLWGIVLIIVGLLVGPGGVSIFT